MKDIKFSTEARKAEHIEICLNEKVTGDQITTGFERYRFKHLALPEVDFSEISTVTEFLRKRLKGPFLVSSMTGGTETAHGINSRLASVAERRGWAIGVGSVRAALENPDLAYSFQIRKSAPSVPIIANLGAVQFNYGIGADHCRRAVDLLEADGLVLHLNSLQEIFQTEGNMNFKDLLVKIEKVCRSLEVPVGVKEVGWGIDGVTARRLQDAGVSFIDVAGAGGTSWSQVEKHRSKDPMKKRAAEAFRDWGNPTAECIREVHEYVEKVVIIASGGIQNGHEAAKAMALGADLVGFGRTLLKAATESEEQLDLRFEQVEYEFRAAMFGIGAGTLQALKNTDRLVAVRA
ncbi:type 2 isopentenyl-diphosphate Delta-isomerase [Effusibacillus lacus]|uniref:Isopentenyl-diphosphate delta-isomerase n=1 Tax=Effusibacillus lacus TaxID=1348429 RepID=A0A292YT03_9BACL|nr:type 2 isopentenyl-diphosphate Delta-isomerase [Effusibacillus lacus]TCS74945.1 isopentenyl-diphosphate delta-isomerase [Effusibacillus lacus]GAX91615.1 type 2 isopentenyl-diphosphate Delta-isomerase [Effusibacillus lacus]